MENFESVFKILKGFTNVDANKLFSIDDLSLTRNNGIKLRCRQIELHAIKSFFTYDVREWNKLPPSVVECNTINSFKNKLDHHLFNRAFDKDSEYCKLFAYVRIVTPSAASPSGNTSLCLEEGKTRCQRAVSTVGLD